MLITQKTFFSFFLVFFSVWVFFHEHSLITGLQGKGEGISLTLHYNFHLLHRRLDVSRAITAESSPLHIASSRTRPGNLWFLSASPKLYLQSKLYLGNIAKSVQTSIIRHDSGPWIYGNQYFFICSFQKYFHFYPHFS